MKNPLCTMCSGTDVIPGPTLGVYVPCPSCFPEPPAEDTIDLKELLEFLRCLKGNHTIDFSTIPKMCDSLFEYVEYSVCENGSTDEQEDLLAQYRKYFEEK